MENVTALTAAVTALRSAAQSLEVKEALAVTLYARACVSPTPAADLSEAIAILEALAGEYGDDDRFLLLAEYRDHLADLQPATGRRVKSGG